MAAFECPGEQTSRHGDVLPRTILAEGFRIDGVYDDSFGADGLLLRYRYRGTDINHADNRGLRSAMERRLPLVYIHGLLPGKYLVTWPVYVVGDDPRNLVFSIAFDDAQHLGLPSENPQPMVNEEVDFARRAYITTAVRVRLHQRAFRERVLAAYEVQCAFCRLRHQELLDAAHIIPDVEPAGEPLVRNGLFAVYIASRSLRPVLHWYTARFHT